MNARNLNCMSHIFMLFIMVIWFCMACTTTPTRVEVDVSNKGNACVDDGAVRVDFQTCLSSSCDTLEASCVVTLDGETLVVTSEATVTSEGDICTTDCGTATTTCALPEGWEAANSLSYAGNTAAVDAACTPQ